MKKQRYIITLIIFVFILILNNKVLAGNIYISDNANVLSDETQQYINKVSNELYSKTDVQISVITVGTLSGRTIENYANNLFDMFEIGGSQHKGILILISSEERLIRVKLGSGISRKITNRKCGAIQDEYIISYLKLNRWNEGVQNGYNAFVDMVCREYNVNVDANKPEAFRYINFFEFITKTIGLSLIAGTIDVLVGLLLRVKLKLESITSKKLIIVSLFYLLISSGIILYIVDRQIGYETEYFKLAILMIIGLKLLCFLFGIVGMPGRNRYNNEEYDGNDDDNDDTFFFENSNSFNNSSGGSEFTSGRGSTRKF